MGDWTPFPAKAQLSIASGVPPLLGLKTGDLSYEWEACIGDFKESGE